MNQIADTVNLVNADISLPWLVIDIFSAAVLAVVLGEFYQKFGRSLSNRSKLARNFVMIAVTTTLIITVVKSSLALSLGLVGALSIVRFRAAIKEPEELAYLFLTIAIGLGFGAGQRLATVVAFGAIIAVIFVVDRFRDVNEKENLFLSLKLPPSKKSELLKDLLNLVSKNTERADLRRVDEDAGQLSVGVVVEFMSKNQMEMLLTKLKEKYPKSKISLLDTSSLLQ